jgi:uncharacterized protein DUF6526
VVEYYAKVNFLCWRKQPLQLAYSHAFSPYINISFDFKSKNIFMQEQNFKNHARYVPEFHFVLSSIIIAVFVMAVINISKGINIVSVMFLLIAISLLIAFVKIRRFPLAAQDRAIRAEENLRYFSLTGKLFDSSLTLSQIIALRFASDDELVMLTDKAIKEKLSNADIKQAIQKWRADHHRA